MWQENVETLRAMMAAFNRRDFEDGVRYVDPEVELHPGITELDMKTRYRGRDEFRRVRRDDHRRVGNVRS